jgi:hypothetical protein
MGTTLDHGAESPPVTHKGHGTAALGPSDSSDSGSDIQGGPGLNRDDGLLSPTGTTSDPDVDAELTTAGPDIGDANLDSDSDRNGTGERAAAGRDSTLPVDVLLRDESGEVVDGETIGDDESGGLGSADELVGSNAEREDIEGGAGANAPSVESYRPAQAAQDARDVTRADDPDHEAEVEPGEHGYARADGKRVTARDDIPVFDRAARDDRPGQRSDTKR